MNESTKTIWDRYVLAVYLHNIEINFLTWPAPEMSESSSRVSRGQEIRCRW